MSAELVKLSKSQVRGFNAVTNGVRLAKARYDDEVNNQRTFLAECLIEVGENPDERWAFNEADYSLIKIPNLEAVKKEEDVNKDPE